ncbi:formate-dependent phosphoribosylglycinamide formyltransferase [Marinicella sp. W31]|uniref:formate-dependent phosphoribosylglycinamide formyltransferase n=1 Tax=Marinicella sp. W31 TaxID=3023713 RepID=UPI00375737B4
MQDFFSTERTQPVKILLLGAGELGKEVVIEAQRLGLQVIAVDRYADAPAMQVADASAVIDMTDAGQLRKVLKKYEPDLVIPEIEAIATDELIQYEQAGGQVVPNANAVNLTMDREGIRKLAAEELEVPTSPYGFVDTFEELEKTAKRIGYPCVVKPVMSSSGKGQCTVENEEQLQQAWEISQSGGRTGAGRIIVEGFVKFDFEITLLTIRHAAGTSFCDPIGHRQEGGDYQESWQPQNMTDQSLAKARDIAEKVTNALGGYGVFGVELFIRGDDVIFSEVSPRPHDTGMVTMISQNLSQFALHIRAVLGLPIPKIIQLGSSASHVILGQNKGTQPLMTGVSDALAYTDTDIRFFGKPDINGKRRLGVCLARGNSLNTARKKASDMAEHIRIRVN